MENNEKLDAIIDNNNPIAREQQHILLVPSQFILEMEISSATLPVEDGAGFPAPPVYIFSQWLKDIAFKTDLLNGLKADQSPDNQQILDVWSQAIQANMKTLESRECDALAKQARAADRLISQWLDEPDPHAGGSDWKAFLQWRSQAHQLLQSKNWFTPEDWQHYFCRQLSAGKIAASRLPKRIQLSGFVETTKLESRVFDALAKAGVEVAKPAKKTVRADKLHIKQFTSLEHELGYMARWARSEVEQGKHRVAVIINGLEGLKVPVRRIFEDTFDPDSLLGLDGFRHSQFHISHPPALAAHPLVVEALQLLEISIRGVRQALEFPMISRLLLSNSWIGASSERFARASLELRVREKGWYRLSLSALVGLAAKHQQCDSMPLLIDRCSTLAPVKRDELPSQQLLDWLGHWGWPAEQGLDEASTHAVRQLLSGLETLSTRGLTSVDECLAQLQRICEELSIDSHGGAWSPLQIMSPAEAFGQHFDAAWVGNLNDSNWPGRALLNPFIPPVLLKDIPRGTDSGMLQYTDRLGQSLSACANEVTFSVAERCGHTPQAISPLLDELEAEKIAVEAQASAPTPLSLLAAPQAGEIIDYATHPWLQAHQCQQGLKLPESDCKPLRGIVTRFNYQAACPLASYLVFRLHARMQDPPQPFADAAFRGRLLHTAMEQLYRPYLGTQGAPIVSDVPPAVKAALQSEYADSCLMPAAFEAERIRLERLLRAWLRLKDLKPGGQPIALEWKCQLSFAGFEFVIRIDRLDRIGHDKAFIIDYKSGGLGKAPAWGNARLDNIQLPLYAVALDAAGEVSPAGLALLQLKSGDFKAYGISADEKALCKGVQQAGSQRGKLAKQFDNWNAMLDFWRAGLELLAVEIQNGDCSHQNHSPDVLRYADLDILLRNSELENWCLEHA